MSRIVLDLDLLNFAIGFHQLVANLQQHTKSEIGFLYRRQHFGFVHIPAC